MTDITRDDAMNRMRAVRALSDSRFDKRHAMGVAALDSIGLFSEKERKLLAKLRPCSRCGLLDTTDPCGDHL